MNEHIRTAPTNLADPDAPCKDCGAIGLHCHIDRTHRDCRTIIRDCLSLAEREASRVLFDLIGAGCHPESEDRQAMRTILAEVSYARHWLDSLDSYPIPDPQRQV